MALKRVFLHNRHDKSSAARLAACKTAGLVIDREIDVYAGDKPDFAGLKVRALPAYVLLSDISGVIASFEEDNLDPALIASLTFEEGPAPTPQPTLEQRILEAEEALAILHAELEAVKSAAPSGA